MNSSFDDLKNYYDEPFFGRIAIFTNSQNDVLERFCPVFVKDLKNEHELIELFYLIVMVNTLGMFT